MSVPAKILVIDDDELIASMLARALRTEGYDVRVETSSRDVLDRIGSWSPAVVLLDIRMPDRSGIEVLEGIAERGIQTQVIMLTADDTAETAVRAMKLGAADYVTKPFNTGEIKLVIRNLISRVRLQQEVAYLRREQAEFVERDIAGISHTIGALKAQIEKMAAASVPTILITGESGTGKELFARYAHQLLHPAGTDSYAPFIRVNCAALPESLLESELFGYEKGSFTDARTDRKGLFELAQDGSLLLDEIGEMRPAMQSKLLRVLEERTVRKVGGSEEVPVALTVIATTNRDLPKAVEHGEFRTDLFYRLNTFNLHIPPLRERREDIPLLAGHFLSVFAMKYNKKGLTGFSPDAEALLSDHDWPGNVRELKNAIERIVVLGSGGLIGPEHLPKECGRPIAQAASNPRNPAFLLPEEGISLDEVEKNLIIQALKKTHNNKAQAAKLLNVSYDTLRYQVKKYGLA
jgi:DNA-binding NtrC family response regulator